MSKKLVSAVVVIMSIFVVTVRADTIWDESVDGPLSIDGLNPTPVVLVSPSDQVLGDATAAIGFLTFAVPASNAVTSLLLNPGSGLVFVDLYAGTDTNGTPLCTGQLAASAPLEVLGVSCPPPLAAGDYTIGVNALIAVPWSLTFTSDVPVELQSFTID